MIEREETFSELVNEKIAGSGAEQKFDFTLRPKNFGEYIGQDEIKSNLQIFIEAARGRKEPLEHTLLHGPPGLGKTTLANIIALELEVNIKTTSGPAIEKQGDIAALLTNLQDGDVIFIDEIHRLKPQIEEILYSAMEDFALDIVIGKGPSARVMRLNLPRFTLIGATTKLSMLSSPLRDRFGHVMKLEYYSTENILEIIMRSSKLLDISVGKEAATHLSKCSRQTPRIANRLLRRVRDFAQVAEQEEINLAMISDTLSKLGIDQLGLDFTDRQILKILIERYKGGPVGLKTLAASIAEEEDTLAEIYEPYLLQLGMIERTARGRLATQKACRHLNLGEC